MYEEFDATIKKLMALIRKVAISLLARSSVNLIFSVLYFLLIGCNSKTVKIGPFEGDLIEEKSLHSGSESVKAYRLFETGSERSPVNEFKVLEILDQRFEVINLYQGFFASWTRKEILNSGADGSISQIDFRLIRYKEDLRILSRIKIEGHHFEHSDGALFFVKYGCCAIPSSTYIYNYLGEKLAECAGDSYLIDREHNDTKLIFCVDAGYLDQNLKKNPSLLRIEIIPQISKPDDDQPFVYAVKKFEISEFKPHGS
ncbi:MAG: hypothetical protein NZO16_06805, partial [Deltaproteobacteria bacterium]|nr:hypothetical protein [Deltaproteobacteria bacterium]